jgi:hypothetical protein
MARSFRPLRYAVAVVVVAVGSLGLSGCLAAPSPVMVTATAGDGRAVVSWHPPLAYRPPITGYEVTPWVGLTAQPMVVFNSPATTQTVTGLTNGVTYTFTVRALDGNGNETSNSNMSNPVTPVSAIGPEFPVSDPVYGPNRHSQSAQSAAFDGTNYLVVWVDQRNANSSLPEIWGARVAPDGTVLDPTGFRISHLGGEPNVMFDGTNYLVVFGTAQGVAAVRVSTSGVVLDQTPIQINANVTTLTVPRVAKGNGSSLLVWWACEPTGQCDSGTPAQSTYQVLGARIASNGTVLDPTPVTIAQILQDSYFNIGSPDVAFDGTNYLVTFGRITAFSPTVQYGIGARQVSGAGVPLGSQDNIFVSGLSGPEDGGRLSFDGTNFFLIWSGQPVGGSFAVRGMLVRPDPLGLLDPLGFDISTAGGCCFAVTFDGSNTLVVWRESSGTVLRRFDDAGMPVDPSPIPIPGVTGAPMLAAGTGQVLLTFAAAAPSSTTPIDAVRIDGGTVLDNPPFPVSAQANDQSGAAIASGPTGSFVVWEDRRSGTFDIYGARSQNGVMLDGTGILIAADGGEPAVAFGGSGYLVVWERPQGVYGTNVFATRVTADGVVLDPGGIQITNVPATFQDHPAVAFDGTNYLVVWSGTGGSNSGVSVARLSMDGTILDPGGVVLTTTNGPSDPAVAFGGGCFFVAWQTKNMYSDGPYFAGERVGTDLTVLDPAPLTVFHGSNSSQSVPQVAFNGTDFLVVWVWQTPSESPDIYGARVTPGGAVLDPFGGLAISVAPNAQTAPHIAANGDGHFFVVWGDTRGPNANSPDIYGARVTDAGVVLDPSGVAIANDNQQFNSIPAVAPNAGPGSWEMTYTRFAPEPPYGSFRVFHRSVNLLN